MNNDFDMVFLVGKHLQEYLGVYEADLFYSDPMIKSVVGAGSQIQRININRYFTNLLLRYRTKVDIQVNNTLLMLIPDGYVEDWFKLFNKAVIPFLKNNNVYRVVHSIT